MDSKVSLMVYVGFAIVLFLVGGGMLYLQSEEDEKVLKEGLEATVEVLDKEKTTMTVPMMVGEVRTFRTQNTYTLKLYVHKELREVSVGKNIYDTVEIGDEVDIVLYEDRLIVLGDEKE